MNSIYRTQYCGTLTKKHIGEKVVLSGWVSKIRDKGFLLWIDLRDREGIVQLVFDGKHTPQGLLERARNLQREFVIQIEGTVVEREAKNPKISTGDIEIVVTAMTILNESKTPPFTIEENTDGGEELRMQYRYLDIRRVPIKENLLFRHKLTMEVRKFLSDVGFIEVETPYLIKSTPEGAEDFIVPSRVDKGMFYALPQSPQTFKQLLMVGGMDKYFQIVKCFRDEDFRADRQPEFTQIDCEMSFVNQEEVLSQFEALLKHLLKTLKGIEIVDAIPRISYADAMDNYGSDKPDIRFDMQLKDITDIAQGRGFNLFDTQEYVGGIVIPNGAEYSRKQIDELIDWVKRPQVGAKGMIWVKFTGKGVTSSINKYFEPFEEKDFSIWREKTGAKDGDLVLILVGPKEQTQTQLGVLRMEMGRRLVLRNPEEFAPLWVVDFPLFSKDEETNHFHAMHHPFTAPKEEDMSLLKSAPEKVKASAYDLVLNGHEIGGGSIRIHRKKLQQEVFKLLGFTPEEAQSQFGFLMDAFQYGAPPHGGIALGLDRLVALLCGKESIRDFIAFPKNNSGRDTMIKAPSFVEESQIKKRGLVITEINDEAEE